MKLRPLLLGSILLVAGALPASAGTLQKSFEGRSLGLSGFAANLTVRTSADASAMSVEITGPDDLLQKITDRRDGETQVVELAQGARADADSGTANPPLTITVTLPRSASFGLEGFVGKAEIGDLDGELALAVEAGTIKAGKAHTAAISFVGSGLIQIASVQGTLAISSSGSGNVELGAIDGQAAIQLSSS